MTMGRCAPPSGACALRKSAIIDAFANHRPRLPAANSVDARSRTTLTSVCPMSLAPAPAGAVGRVTEQVCARKYRRCAHAVCAHQRMSHASRACPRGDQIL
jgi:hypothetical protein